MVTSAPFAAQREGYSRSDEGPILGAGGWHFATVILFAVSVGIAAAMWKDPEARRVGIGIVAVCAVPLAFTIFRLTRLLRRIGRAQLLTPYESLALGYPTTATYVRPLRGGASVESIEARLQCEEHLTKGSGKNKRTLTEIVHDEELKPVTTPMLNELRLQIPFRIPEKGPPSIDDKGAKIKWMIRLRLRMRDCPNTRSSFDLNVLPAVVKR